MTSDPSQDLLARIDALDDRRALGVLAAVAQRHGFQADSAAAKTTQAHVEEALHQPDLAELAPADDTGAATAGEVARLTLTELARRDPTTAADIDHAITMPGAGERFEPITLVIGALVLFAFHADIDLQKDPDKGWSFRFRTKPIKDSTIGTILTKLFTATG
jgi:hypothetical protein